MPFVPAICPKCGGTLSVNDSEEAAICQYCGTPFIVEKAINNFNTKYVINNTTNNTTNVTAHNTTNIENSEVHIHQDVESAQSLLDNLKAQLERGNTFNVSKIADKIVEKYPSDYRADEATLLNCLKEGLEHEINEDSVYFPIHADFIIKDFLALRQSNSDVCAQYLKKFENNVNAYLNNSLKKSFSGGLAFYKLYTAQLHRILDKLKSEFPRLYEHIGSIEETAKISLLDPKKQVCEFIVKASSYLQKAYSELQIFRDFIVTGKLKQFPDKSVANLDINGYDDSFCKYLADEVTNYGRRLSANISKYNTIVRPYETPYQSGKDLLIDSHIFKEISEAALDLLSPGGKAELEEIRKRRQAELLRQEEERRRAEEEKRRLEQAERDRHIQEMLREYRELLEKGKIKNAYDLMFSATYYKKRDIELRKFKKTLFGYKYLGNDNK